jgi:glycosyltransferase involved in cell wall biosynthesis
MKYSVLIATYNRAADLRGTLDSLAGLRPDGDWEVVVIDNNSTDSTQTVVQEAARSFPAPLRAVRERIQGRSAALNAGLAAARGGIVATTDDDVRVRSDWLTRAGDALDRLQADYVGGRVLPIWTAPRPAWLPDRNCRQWAVIALLDYGPQPMAFGTRVPLGVNMAFRRAAFERAGGFDARVGRRAGTLLGQEVREWCVRARGAGLRGMYAPGMVVRHVIPAARLTKSYFRRWFYWRGVSRAMLYEQAGLDMEAPERRMLDFSRVPHVAGVPRYMYRKLVRTAGRAVRDRLRGDHERAFEQELWVCFFAGLLRQRLRDRGRVAPVTPAALSGQP